MQINPEQEQNFCKRSRFLVIGDVDCGKTSIINYLCNPDDNFRQKATKTVGCEIHVKEVLKQENGENYYEYVEFWELSGDIIQGAQLEVYLRAIEEELESLKGIIFFFDTTNMKSLLRVNKYLEDIVNRLLIKKSEIENEGVTPITIPFLVVGTKDDLLDKDLKIKKIITIKEYIDWMFEDEASKLKCLFLSLKSSYSQFDELKNSIQACIDKDFSKLYSYVLQRRRYSYDRITEYTKAKLKLLSKDLKRVQNFLSLKRIQFFTLVSALVFIYRNGDQYRQQ